MLGPSLTPFPDDRADPLVEGWWAATVSGRGTVVPDGATDLLWIPGQVPILAGPDRVPRPVELVAGTRLIGLRLRPGVAPALLGDRLDRAVGRPIPLDRVRTRVEVERLVDEIGRVTAVPAASIETGAGPWPPGGLETEAMHEVDAEAAAVARVLARVVAWLVPGGWEPDRVVVEAAAAIRIGRTPDPAGLGSRQFRRRFSEAMGYGPSLYRRVTRLDRATHLMARHPQSTLAELAAATGFYDQAHFSRDCRELLGTTPAALRADLSPGPGENDMTVSSKTVAG